MEIQIFLPQYIEPLAQGILNLLPCYIEPLVHGILNFLWLRVQYIMVGGSEYNGSHRKFNIPWTRGSI
jgi:hypothetical protein